MDSMARSEAAVLAEVDAFLTRSGMSATALGKQALGDPGLVRGLRTGRTLRPQTYERLSRFMASFQAENGGDASGSIAGRTSIDLRPELLREAEELGLDVSAAVNASLSEIVKAELAKRWKAENFRAIEAYNQRVQKSGCFGDKLRRF